MSSAWYLKNIEESRRKAREYYQLHKEERKKYSRKYKKENPYKIKLYNKEYYKSGKSKESIKHWKENNKERINEYHRIYHKENKDKFAQYERNRRAKKFGCWGNISFDEWTSLLSFYNNKCLCCGKSDIKLTLDHVLPLSLGGKHELSNSQPLCGKCNCIKNKKYVDYRAGKIFTGLIR